MLYVHPNIEDADYPQIELHAQSKPLQALDEMHVLEAAVDGQTLAQIRSLLQLDLLDEQFSGSPELDDWHNIFGSALRQSSTLLTTAQKHQLEGWYNHLEQYLSDHERELSQMSYEYYELLIVELINLLNLYPED